MQESWRFLLKAVALLLVGITHAALAAEGDSQWPTFGFGGGTSRESLQGGPPRRLCSLPGTQITEKDMSTALSLGTSFMLQSQTDAGHFSYQYDWKLGSDPTEKDAGAVSAVREAGAAWGLALIALDVEQTEGAHDPKLAKALRKTLDFFEEHSQLTDKGLRLIAYPGLEKKLGGTGTLAILTLAYVDYLRTQAPEETERARRLEFLKGLVKSLQASFMKNGLVHSKYSLREGSFSGPHSPYYDGEVLLALTKAAKYLDVSELWPDIDRLTHAGWDIIVSKGLRRQEDLDLMKSYYQWSSMAWHELLTSEHAAKYAEFQHRLVDYGLWMVEVHQVARKNLNTGYAFEGLIPAFVVSRQSGLKEAQNILGCAIDSGMRRVTSMQIGHPLAVGLAAEAPSLERTRGGVQNSLTEPGLRIDTTQHQMHAVIMMKRLLSGRELI